MNAYRKVMTGLACAGTAAAFIANAGMFLHGGWNIGLMGVSAAFVVLVTLAIFAWRRSRAAMGLITVLSALFAVGAVVLLANSLGAPMYDSLLLPFAVFLVPFHGLIGALPYLAASLVVTAVTFAWLALSAWFWRGAGKANL